MINLNNTYIILLIILFTLFTVTFIKISLKNRYKISIIQKDNIDKKILNILDSYEKFLSIEGFTKRILLKYTFRDNIYYRAYYFNILNGTHLFIEVAPDTLDTNYIFITNFKNYKLISYSNSFIEKFKKKRNQKINRLEHLPIEEIYDIHKQSIKIVDKEPIKIRLSNEKLQNRRVKPPKEEIELQNTPLKIFLKISTLVIIAIAIYYSTFTKNINEDQKTQQYNNIFNPKNEMEQFGSKVDRYQLVTLTPIENLYPIDKSLNSLDKYLKNSSIKREINPPIDINTTSLLPCPIPKDLQKIYRWHNGISNIMLDRDLYSYSQLIKNYNQNNKGSNYIIFIGNKKGDEGLAYNCKKRGIYEYSAKDKISGNKEFYSISHLFYILANAYKSKAFYTNGNNLELDIKNFLNIYKKSLTKIDKERYQDFIKYLKKKAQFYKSINNKELTINYLDKIGNLYEEQLVDTIASFLDSNNSSVKLKAVETLSKIGGKKANTYLKKIIEK